MPNDNKPTMTIDGVSVPLNGARNLLEMIRAQGIDLPTFCYHSELSVYGACRMCLVEEEKMGLIAACSTPPQAGMVIRTTTPRVQRVRRTMLELLLANHNRDCTVCEKNGSCRLQELCQRFGVNRVRFPSTEREEEKDVSAAGIVRDPTKCILCGDCVRVCAEVQGIGAIDFAYRGAKARVAPAFEKNLAEVDCVNCGQCVAVCPTGALTVKSQIEKVWDALQDEKRRVVVQVAPAVRVAIGEAFGLAPGEISTGKLVAALKRLGFAGVFDTSFAADLTTIEETNEFLTRVAADDRLPLFTSCCPAWVRCVEQYYPERLNNLSSCRSPQQMFGSLMKKHYAPEIGLEAADLFVVSLMPCTAKKFEAGREEFTTDGDPDVDAVISTQEIARMIKEVGILFSSLEEESFDTPFGFATGAGVIFGASGGVATSVLRTAYELVTGQPVTDVEFTPAANLHGVREASVSLGDIPCRVAVVSGLGNARKLMAALDRGEAAYDMVEVMACPGGCAGGGGQPLPNDTRARQARANGLQTADKRQQIRRAQDNPLVQQIYRRWLGKPNSHQAHESLHTAYGSRRRIQGEEIDLGTTQPAVDVSVCVGTSCYARGSCQVLQTLMSAAEQQGVADRINFKATFCLESCDKGPTVQVGDRVLHGVSVNDVPRLLDEILADDKSAVAGSAGRDDRLARERDN
ncbi:MAG: NADH-dependent [FeFe] hydrogenase, group A6 [Chloroflexota bacterium]